MVLSTSFPLRRRTRPLYPSSVMLVPPFPPKPCGGHGDGDGWPPRRSRSRADPWLLCSSPTLSWAWFLSALAVLWVQHNFFLCPQPAFSWSVHKILSSVAWHACSPFHKASLSSFHEQGECICVVSALLQPGHRSPREDRCSHSGSSSWLVQGSVQSPGQANLSLGAWAEAGPDREAANGSWRFKLLTTRVLTLRAASPFLRLRLPVSYRWARALFLLPCSPLTNTLSLAGMSLCNPEPHEEH